MGRSVLRGPGALWSADGLNEVIVGGFCRPSGENDVRVIVIEGEVRS